MKLEIDKTRLESRQMSVMRLVRMYVLQSSTLTISDCGTSITGIMQLYQ